MTQPTPRPGGQSPQANQPPRPVPNVSPMLPMQVRPVDVGAQRSNPHLPAGAFSHPAAPVTVGANLGEVAWNMQSAHPAAAEYHAQTQMTAATAGGAYPPDTMMAAMGAQVGGAAHQTGPGTAGARSLNVTPNKLVIPQFVPIFDPQRPNGVVPFSTQLIAPGDSREIYFEIPRGPLGPFVVIGFWAMLCAPAEDVAANTHPLVWLDPDADVYSDVEGTPLAPPDFIGPRAGDRFTYILEIAGDKIDETHHGHLTNCLRTIPIPIQVPSGAQGKFTVIRQPSARFAPDTDVYLLCGLFGRLHHTIVPPFPLDACRVPVRPVAYTTRSVTIPAPGTGTLGQLGRAITVPIDVVDMFPTVFSHLLWAGASHCFMRFSWQVGFMSSDFVPVKLFQYLTAGGWLPAPVLTNGSTRFNVELAQASIIDDQPDFTGAVSIEGASYGVS